MVANPHNPYCSHLFCILFLPKTKMQRQKYIHSKVVDNLPDPEDGEDTNSGGITGGKRHESELADAVDTIHDDDADPVF